MAKPKRPEAKLPSMKLIKSCASKCEGYQFIYIGIACYPDGKTAFSLTVQEQNGSFGGTVYVVVDLGASLPQEVLYNINCHNIDISKAFITDDTLILKYDGNILDDLIQSSNTSLIATGDKTILEGIITYLQRRGERPSLEITRLDFVEKNQCDLPTFFQHQFSHMDSTGITCYEDIVKLTPLLSSEAINYQYGFSAGADHRHGIVFTDGKSLIWVPDEDPLDTYKTILGKRLLQTVKGRAYTIIDLLRDPDHGDLALIGMLATGEIFAVKHPQIMQTPPEAEAIKTVYPTLNTVILSIPLSIFMEYVGRISSLKKKDRIGASIKFTEDGNGRATWFCKRHLDTNKDTQEETFRLDTFCEQDLVVTKAFEELPDPYDKYYDQKLEKSFALSVVPALPFKTFIGAKLCDMTDYYIKVCAIKDVLMWVISPDRCNFGEEVATCVTMPIHNGYSVLSDEDKAALQIN